MGNLVTKKKPVAEPPPTPDEITRKQKSQEFYKELDSYRGRGGCLPVLALLIVTAGLIALVAWYLQHFH